MFKGYKKLYVLMELAKAPASGYTLMKNIGDLTGKKPSAGTMYPLLKDLKDKEMVKVKVEGKKHIYSITAKGKTLLKRMCGQHDMYVDKLIKELEPLTSKKEFSKLVKEKHIFAQTKGHMVADADVFHAFKMSVFEAYRKDIKNRKKIREIIQKATKEIKKLTK